jgi:ABC-type phosphonate transport system ATPase subunit
MSDFNFIESYLDFYADTEVPTIFNRWSAITGISALLGRQCWVEHGHNVIYPNMYVMLVGESGTRKSTAVGFSRKLLTDVGYKKFAAKKTSKEKVPRRFA